MLHFGRITMTAAALVFALPGVAFAQAQGYANGPGGLIWKNNFGQCWRTGFWTPAMAIAECDAALAPATKPGAVPPPPVSESPLRCSAGTRRRARCGGHCAPHHMQSPTAPNRVHNRDCARPAAPESLALLRSLYCARALALWRGDIAHKTPDRWYGWGSDVRLAPSQAACATLRQSPLRCPPGWRTHR